MKIRNLYLAIAVLFVLTSCSGESPTPEPSGEKTGAEETIPVKTQYDFANGCYALKSVANNGYVKFMGAGYEASADLKSASAFFMKPSGLGTYILYDSQARYMSVGASQIAMRTSTLDDNAVWELEPLGENLFALKSTTKGKWLAVSSDNAQLILAISSGLASEFQLEEAADCKPFPEADLNVDIKDFNGQSVDPSMAMARPAVGDPIVGFADVHVHLNHFLASGQTTFVGETFNPLGIEEALRDCSPLHGKNGSTDILGMVQDGNSKHNTDGWPTFSFWPTANSQTHQQAYYRWIERAWLSGERLMVQEMVNAQILAIVKNGLIKPQVEIMPQDDISVVDRQIKNMYEMQDYIDAQCGGPGKGWFRICKSSTEARQAISQGKMAVILAIEIDSLCNVGEDYCEDYASCEDARQANTNIDKKLNSVEYLLDKYYNLGIRTIFPVHGINNGYGGAWLYVNMVWDLGNKIMRGNFYDITLSPDPRVTYKESGIEYAATQTKLIDFLNKINVDLPYAPEIPPYDPNNPYDMGHASKGHANGQGLTKIGAWLIQELVDRGIVVEVDHMSNKTVNGALKILWDNKYPGIVATHGGITDIEPPDVDGGTHEQLDIPRMIMITQLGGLFSEHLGGRAPSYAGPAMYGNEFCYLDYLRYMIKTSNDNKSNPEAVGELNKVNDPNVTKKGYFRYHTKINNKTGKYEEYPYEVPTSWYNLNDDPTDDLIVGQPMTTDVNGACSLPRADTTATQLVDYDGGFGALYPGLYNESVIDSSKVKFHKQVTGNRTFDINTDGMSHYGLMPDEIKLRQAQDPNLKLDAFFNGAEAYLRMLNRVERYHKDSSYPSRDQKYWNLENYEDWWNWQENSK